jgi:hypothetical protein
MRPRIRIEFQCGDGYDRRTQRHERMGADARRDAAQLPVKPQQQAAQRGEPEPQHGLLQGEGRVAEKVSI